jgi:phytanoyl-CoA hydroxylase
LLTPLFPMTDSNSVSLKDIEVYADSMDLQSAAETYHKHGCLVVRGLMKPFVTDIHRDVEAIAAQSISLLDKAEKVPEGWKTPDNTLFIPAPEGFVRDKQLMVLAFNYHTSAAFFHSAFYPKTLELVKAAMGPDIEIFGEGQCIYKEPVGGHPKNLHQDSAYFEHKYEGPMAMLSYAVDTDLVNGALHVIPGSHRLGQLKHIDTFSHLGLDENEWPWESSIPVIGEAGDAIFFHVKTIHGSKENHSQNSRPVFIHRYRRADDYVVVRATNEGNRAEAEAEADKVRKSEDLGLMACGIRRYED